MEHVPILQLSETPLSLQTATSFVFQRKRFESIEIAQPCRERVQMSWSQFQKKLSQSEPIYGVTTGFGDSCSKRVDAHQSAQLQENLISYLLCGTGPCLPVEASRAALLFRLLSLSRGYSGVSLELIDRMKLYLEHDWIPVIPREGSLGASGDLVPLAYIASALQGQGMLHLSDGTQIDTELVLKKHGIKPYVLKPKEGLALVNGTSAMCGMYLQNIVEARYLLECASLASSWLCLCLQGKPDAFGDLINQRAKNHSGQAAIAQKIADYLSDESESLRIQTATARPIQDRYSLRCAPQILGPIEETLQLCEKWLEAEINGVSDNPVISPEGEMANGGNFYGGHLSQGMDYLKICIGHLVDMLDRQMILLIDEKSNRGLPPNLADWSSLPESERSLHHGLKGLNQAVSAMTSEVLARAMPSGLFSRSTEAHNQDKVSLGMSAAVSAQQMLEQAFTITAMYFTALAQGLTLRKIQLKGIHSQQQFEFIRQHVPFVQRDQRLDHAVQSLAQSLRQRAHHQRGSLT